MAGLLDPREGDGTWVENRPSKWQQTWDIFSPYITAPAYAVKGLMDTPLEVLLGAPGTEAAQDEAVANAFNVAGAVTGGSSVVPKPRNALMMGFDGSPSRTVPPTLREVLDAKAKQMELKPEKRIQPDPARSRVIDQSYRDRAPGGFATNLAESYPRNPDPAAKLPLNDRARFLIDRKQEIGSRLAEKIREAGQVGADTQFFYHSDGPIYRAAINAGLTHDEARKFLDDFAQAYAATSPRTNTEQNLLNTSLVMAKNEAGIPFREVIGQGTVDAKGNKGISEKGYPMMTGKGGIHGNLLDDVAAGGIDVNSNPKPFNFGNNMAGNLSGVTADTHAIRGVLMTGNELYPGQVPLEWIMPEAREAYLADPTILRPEMILDTLESQMVGPKGNRVSMQTEYPVVADVWHTAANELGVSPAEAQSMGWFGLGGETNLGSKPKTVADLMDERINVTSQALGIPSQDVANYYFRRKIPLMALPAGLLGAGAYSQMSADEAQAGAM